HSRSSPPLYPYTTLFRSAGSPFRGHTGAVQIQHQVLDGTGSGGIIFTRPQIIVIFVACDEQPAWHGAPAPVFDSGRLGAAVKDRDRKSTRLNSSHVSISY